MSFLYFSLAIFFFISNSLPPLFGEVIERLVPIVVAKLPHSLPAFTQGLAIDGDVLYESTGLYGQSSLRCLDIVTGKIKKRRDLPSYFFAEGIAAFPSQIIQMTWKEGKAFLYDRASFQVLNVFTYHGEAWGLCRENDTVWMSDGSSKLTQRDFRTFAILRTLEVYKGENPIDGLNDLECDGKSLYANVWPTHEIIRIDKMSGKVTGICDASHLLSSEEKGRLTAPDHVLNGMAFRSATGTFFLTGKEWPWIFEVKFTNP